jgi:hypothetical protein
VRYKKTLFILIMAFGALGAAAAPALAAERHFFAAGFGSFASPVGVAVNESTQHVYVTDMASAVVNNFEASGAADPTTPQLTGVAFVQPYGVAVDNSGGSAEDDIYVADLGAGAVDQFDQAGASTGSQITVANVPTEGTVQSGGLHAVVNNGAFSPTGVAVGSSGHVFVADTSNNVVDEFSSSGVFVEQLGAGLISGLQLIAVSGAGDLYVANATGTVELDAAGSCVDVACGPLDAAGTIGVAVDGAGNVYASEGNQIAKYDAAGTLLERFGTPTAFPAFGGLVSAYGIGVDDVTHAVYLADPGAAAGDIFNLLTVPDLTSETPSGVQPTTAILKGMVNPAGSTVSACQFEWGTEPAIYPNVLPCTEPILPLAGSTTVGASAEVSGLEPGHVYHYRLSVTNENVTVYSEDESFSAKAMAPTIAEESVTEDSATGVRLNAEIDPGGAETTYHFQYGTTAGYGQSTPETALFASDNGEHRAAAILQDLQPGTVYHYRLVVSNSQSGGAVPGSDRTFTTHSAGAVFALPDGRVWEQVSPVNKEGAEITTADLGFGGDMQASENGQEVTYVASAPLGAGVGVGGQSSPIENQVLSTREEGGAWSSQDLDTPHNYASAIENGESLHPNFNELDEYQIFSPDLSLAYVEPEGHTQLASTPVLKDGEDERETYVRDSSTGVFTATTSSANEWYAEQVTRAQGPPSCDASTSPAHGEGVDATGSDGCYVYFNSESILAAGATSGQSNLYVSHFDGSGWETTFISSLSGTGFPEWGGLDVELSPNGQYVAFMSNVTLTGYDNLDVREHPTNEEEQIEERERKEEEEATGEPSTKTRQVIVKHHDEEVFEYDAATNHLVCASCDPTGARPVGVRDPGVQGYPPFSAPLMVDRNSQWTGRWLAGILPDWTEKGQTQPIYQPRYISNSGRLLFNSPEALAPADVNGLEDVYEYEPAGGASGGSGSEEAPPGETCTPGSSSGGSTYEPAGTFDVEGREGESGPGCVALITSGTSGQESAFVDASASGGDVFFLTSARLVGQDDDTAYDVYDASVCNTAGTHACPPAAAVPPPPCDTEASCKAAPSRQPEIYGAPASATFTGAGNLIPTPANVAPKKTVVPMCKRGFVRNNKRKCVRKKAKRAKRASTKRKAHR